MILCLSTKYSKLNAKANNVLCMFDIYCKHDLELNVKVTSNKYYIQTMILYIHVRCLICFRNTLKNSGFDVTVKRGKRG